MRGRRFFIILGCLALAAALAPLLVTNPYYLNVLNVLALNALVVTGLNLLIGYAGQISLGHAAFYGLGAYISAILTGSYGWDPWTTLLFAALVVAAVALILGIPTLRLKGNYLVMATLGFNLIVNILTVQLDDITGGPSGYIGVPPLPFFAIELDTDQSFYWMVWSIALLGILFAGHLTRSRVGRGLRALHDSPVAAAALGVPVETYKIKTFIISAIYASVAGSLYSHYMGMMAPNTFNIFMSIELTTMCIIGGMGTVFGGLIGALFITPLPQLLHFFDEYKDIIYGGVLILVLMFMPGGIGGWVYARLGKRRA
jgi:branched-chain amino acid transport system permease protein